MSVYKAGKNRQIELPLIYLSGSLNTYDSMFERVKSKNYYTSEEYPSLLYLDKTCTRVANNRREQRFEIGKILGIFAGNTFHFNDCNCVSKTEFYWRNDVKEWYTQEELDLEADGKIFLPERPKCPYDCGIPKRIFAFI